MADDTSRCPRCGAVLPGPGEPCPACLLRSALEPTVGTDATHLTPAAMSEGARRETTADIDKHPAAIGPYRIIRVLGEGGMGVVYLAEQREPLRRQVALKVIKLGMDTHDVVGRFETERRTLALMDHPNIASVFDAGATVEGRPYFVMEYVAGAPITEYCDIERLSMRRRLELFTHVCAAVQHAHQKGVIHRDLKPSNVLVTIIDGQPVPKVIDFGIAKATDQQAMEKLNFTQLGMMVGTPEYMSPEQADPGAIDLDTRKDVYALGVILYELLIGVVPFSSRRLREAGYSEMIRIICEEEPPRPSTRATTSLDSAEIAARRQTRPATLTQQLRGDLDWITLRALEKDRARRYPTVSDLAADIARFLNHEPVSARPPSISYRARKFVARNRLSVTAAAIVLLAILAGLVTSQALYVQASRAKREADMQRDAATEQRNAANEQRARAIAERARADSARQEADSERTAALGSAATARAASAESQSLRSLAEQRECAANVMAADISLRAGNWNEAQRRLSLCPIVLRGFEWNHVNRSLDSSDLSVQLPGAIRSIAFSADGSRVEVASMPHQEWFTGCRHLFAVSASGQDMPRVPTRVGQGSEIAASRDGRLAVVSLWRAAEVRQGDSPGEYWAADGAETPLGPPAGFLRLRDTVAGRDIATLELPAAGRIQAAAGSVVRMAARDGGLPLKMLATMSSLSPDSGPPCRSDEPPPRPQRKSVSTTASMLSQLATDSLAAVGMVGPPSSVSGSMPYVADAVFSSDATRVAVWSWSNDIHIWDTASGRRLGSITTGPAAISALVFTSDSARVIAASDDGRIRVWTIEGSRPVSNLTINTSPILSIAVSANGQRLVSGSQDGSVRVWDLSRGTVLWAREDAGVARSVDLSRDGELVVSAGETCVCVWNAETGQGVAQFYSQTRVVQAVSFSPDGRRVASGGVDGVVRVWSLRAASASVVGRQGSDSRSIGWSRDGQIVTKTGDGSIRVWDSGTLQPPDILPRPATGPPGTPTASEAPILALSPTGEVAAISYGGPAVSLWNIGRRQVIGTCMGLSRPTALVFDAAGDRLFVSGRELTICDGHTGTTIRSLTPPASLTGFVATPDGKWFLSGGGGGDGVSVWDARAVTIVRRILNDRRGVSRFAIHPGSKEIALAGYADEVLAVRDLLTGDLLRSIVTPDRVTSLAYSPDGTRIATALADGSIRIWDSRTLDACLTAGADTFVAGVNPTPERMLSPNAAAIPLNKAAFSLEPPTAVAASAVAFSPDGMRIASTWADGTIRVISATPKNPFQQARDLFSVLRKQAEYSVDVIHRVQRDAAITPDVRDAVVKFAQAAPDDPELLISLSRIAASAPTGTPDEYQLAFLRAEDAVRQLAGASPEKLAEAYNVLAIAQYRTARFREAQVSLVQATRRRKDNPSDLIVSALVQIKLGQRDAARAALDRIFEPLVGPSGRVGPQPTFQWDADMRGLERELHAATIRYLASEARDLLAGGDPNYTQARSLVESISETAMFSDLVIERLQNDKSLSTSMRTTAIRLARELLVDDPAALNSRSWTIVKRPGASQDDYRLARRMAQKAVDLGSTAGRLNTLALAMYRVGDYEKALATIAQASKLRSPGASPTESHGDLVIAVMIRLRLGQRAEAQSDLDRLLEFEKKIAASNYTGDVELRSLIQEAKALATIGKTAP